MGGARKIRILVVDDHPFLREGIVGAINSQIDMALIGEASNGQEAIEQFRLHRPDVTLMDLQMPTMNGTDAIIAIRDEFRQLVSLSLLRTREMSFAKNYWIRFELWTPGDVVSRPRLRENLASMSS